MLIGIVAGETSGDMLGAGLIKALRQHYPHARFAGVGGPLMIAAGFDSITPMERLSVMGFVEPLGRLPELLRLKRDLVALFKGDGADNKKADVFIGIDSPGFNLRLEQNLHDIGVPTVHYVSPSVWAWGEGRLTKIAKAVDLMLTLFPFETTLYQKNQIAVHCVGHSLADRIDPNQDQLQARKDARNTLGLAQDSTLICLMPGSRKDEVQRLAPVFLQTAMACLAARPGLHFVLPCANQARREQLETILSAVVGDDAGLARAFSVLDGHSLEAMQASDLVLLASGTATLEAMLLKRPMVVCYKLSAVTWALASRLVKVPYVSLPNLLAGRELVPELLQHEVTVENLRRELFAWLDDTQRQSAISEAYLRIHQSIRLDADQQAAKAIAGFLGQRQSAAAP